MSVNITWLIRRDMPRVLEIDWDVFEYPWAEEDFLFNLRQRNCIGMVARLNDKIVGYMIYELRGRSLGIKRIAVSREHQRSGVGRQMIEWFKNKLSQQRRRSIELAVDETNETAIAFFAAMDFRASLIRGDDEDQYQFRYSVPCSVEVL